MYSDFYYQRKSCFFTFIYPSGCSGIIMRGNTGAGGTGDRVILTQGKTSFLFMYITGTAFFAIVVLFMRWNF